MIVSLTGSRTMNQLSWNLTRIRTRRIHVNKTRMGMAAMMLFVSGLPALAQKASEKMNFFITSEGSGNGANLGGLAGADQHCQDLAKAVGAGNRTWHAYLSTSAAGGKTAVNAKDRIGKGPWYNAKGNSSLKI